jgi:hypothetical protein
MMRTGLARAILTAVVAVMLMGDPGIGAPPAAAQVDPVNAGLGLFRVINAINRRNRTYQAARDTKGDFDAYYGSLQDTARAQLISGELHSLRSGASGPEAVRAAAYIRLTQALAAEQTAINRAIDAETNQARRDFNRTLVQQLQEVIIRVPGAQQILSNVRTVISNVRTTVIALQAAANANQPLDVLTQQLAEQVSSSAIVQQQVRDLGSMLGPDLDRALGGALTQVNASIEDVNREANQAVTLLDGMDAQVAELDLSRAEVAEGDRRAGPLNIRVTDRATAALDVASQALAYISLMQSPGETTREQLYQQIRNDLLQERNAALLHAAQTVRLITCTSVGRGEYELMMGMLGRPPAVVADTENPTYIVCTDRETGQPVRAFVVGARGDATATPGEGTPTTEPEIPTGTYTGTTTYPETFSIDRTIAENSVTVTVTADGTLTGDLRVMSDHTEVITQDCSVTYHQEFTGAITGKLDRSDGYVDLQAVRTGISGHCDGSSESWSDPPGNWPVSIRVIDGVMTGEVGGVDGSQDAFFTFTADRQ